MASVPIGQYFLSPYSVPSLRGKTTDEVILPTVPEVRLAKPQSEQQPDNHEKLGTQYVCYSMLVYMLSPNLGFLHIDQLPIPKGSVFEFIAKQNGCSVKKRETNRTKQ